MKKLLLYALFISSSIIFLSPLNAFAADDFASTYVTWQNSSGSTLPTHSGTGLSYTTISRPNSSGWIQTSVKPNNNTIADDYYYNYMIISVGFEGNQQLSAGTWQVNNGTDIFLQQSYGATFLMGVQYDGADWYNCYPLGSQHGETSTFTMYCPIKHNNTTWTGVRFYVYYDYMVWTDDVVITLDKWMLLHYKDQGTGGIESAINNQTSSITNAQNQTTNAINNLDSDLKDSSTTDANNSANSFFSGFQTESFGHLTDIITAPLSLFSAITSSTCNPITLNVDFSDSTNGAVGSKNVVLPCGTTLFWENASLGNKVSNFRTFWNILLGAPLIYGCLLLLVRSFNGALDPLNDELISFEYNKDSERVYRDMKSQEVRDMAKLNHEGGLNAAQYKKFAILRRKK